MASPKIQTVLKKFNEAPEAPYDNYDKVKISLSKGNKLLRNRITEQVICTAPLSEPFKFNAAPQYTTFGELMQKYNSNPVGEVFEKIRGFADSGTMSADRNEYFGRIESAKLYKGVSDISYNFNFTCFEDLDRYGNLKRDDDATKDGDSIVPFLVFTSMSFPNMPPEFMEKMNAIFEDFSQGGNGVWETIKGAFKGVASSAITQIEAGFSGSTSMFKTIFGQSTGNYPSDHFADKTQNCIDIEVSNVCMLKNMVIKNFNATFSREILENGLPVYTKYSLDVEPIVQPTNQELFGIYSKGEKTYFSNFKELAGGHWGQNNSDFNAKNAAVNGATEGIGKK